MGQGTQCGRCSTRAPTAASGTVFARLGRQALRGHQGPQQQAAEAAGWAGGDGARRGWQGVPGKARALACDGRSAKARPAGVDLYLLFREAPPHLPGLGDVSMQMTPSPTPGTGGHPSAPQPPSHRLHTPHPPWEGPTLHTL